MFLLLTRYIVGKARQVIRSISTETQRNIHELKRQKRGGSKVTNVIAARFPSPTSFDPDVYISPEVLSLAREHPRRLPTFLQPPVLSSNRLRIDPSSIYLYAAEGCTTLDAMWATALSYARFNGPRRHAPFRELYTLSEPDGRDASDWAENIRWAKEQYRVFGSDTWTEYDYHLERITEHRRAVFWVSEEAVMATY